MNNVNKTLYIPLYGKSYVSKKGLFLSDKMAEKIWEYEGFELKGKSKSKWLCYYMGVRSAVFDEWVKNKISEHNDSVVIHLGCGMDSRVLRVGAQECVFYDVDFPEVIEQRKRYYSDSDNYKMISADVRDAEWLKCIKGNDSAIVVMEGVSMYLTIDEMKKIADALCSHFDRFTLLVDVYSSFAARMSKYKNPVNDVGVTEVYGIDDPKAYEVGEFSFEREHTMTPQKYIDELSGFEKLIFGKLYAGNFSKKLYRLFEYKKNNN